MDFANLRESAQASSSMANSLERMSQFAFGQAKKEQDRVNTLTAIQARTDLESEVQKRMAQLTVKVETGQLTDFGQIQSEIQAMSGWADSIKDLDIDQANGLLSSIRTSGKALLAKSSDILVKNYQAGLKVQVQELNKDYELTMQTVLEADPTPASFDHAKSMARGHVYSVGVQAGNANDAMKEFDESATRARDSVLAKHFLSAEFATKPSEALSKLSTGNAGKYSEIWATMGEGERDKVTQRILKQSADIYGQQEREKNLNKEAAKAKGLDIRERHYKGQLSATQTVKELKAIGDIERTEMESLLKGDGPGANLELYGRFESVAAQGIVGEAYIDELASSRIINWKQAADLKAKVRGVSQTDAEQYINKSLGVPDPLTPGFRNERARAASVLAEFNSRRADALAAGEPFNPMSVARELVGDRKKQDDVKLEEQTREQLRKDLDAAGMKYSEEYTDDDLKRAGVDGPTRKRIMRRINALKG